MSDELQESGKQHATPGQVEAGRAFFRRHPRPHDRWAQVDAIQDELRQDADHYWRGGNR